MRKYIIEILKSDVTFLHFKITLEPKRRDYILISSFILFGLILLLLRSLYFLEMLYINAFVLLISLIFFLFGFYFIISITTTITINFNIPSLKLSITKTQVKFFNRSLIRTFSGMNVNILKNSPSFLKWPNFFPVISNKILIFRGILKENNKGIRWTDFFEDLQRILRESTSIHKGIRERKIKNL